jgi:CDGSH-type Zn-finger protein/truncated hemoglobin YjbI/uncharacterized Fe-S cluster protein YjdI
MSDSDVSENIESIKGEALTLVFAPHLCIHSRHCVLEAPDVFRANTPGDWIFPDAIAAAKLSAVIRNCPSGALTYRNAASDIVETPPPVNLLKSRENGPLALTGELYIGDAGEPVTRRTLCRCGASRNKPFCDGSHAEINFIASGEPPSGDLRPLETRDGPVRVNLMPDGPIEIIGSIECVSGTGRTFDKTTHTLLCRCGGSTIKPYCDGTHSLNGFCDRPGPSVRDPETVSAPPLAEWAGGRERIAEMTRRFYARVPYDPVLAPVFANMAQHHAEHVADFLAEVFGGGPIYSQNGGSHVGMIAKHLGRHITEDQRAHWLEMMIEMADEVGLPHDPAFRTAFVNYLEWGSRLAVINSADGVKAPEGDIPMPQWGWGAALGPTVTNGT